MGYGWAGPGDGYVGGVRKRRAPGVGEGGDADAHAEMAGVGGDGDHCLGRRLEQQIIDDRLVLKGDVGDLGGDCEDHVKIADRQQVGLARSQPLACGDTLALGTVPVAATVIGDAEVAAVLAAFEVTAERPGTAVTDPRPYLQPAHAPPTPPRPPLAL